MSTASTHVLDAARGRPAAGLAVTLAPAQAGSAPQDQAGSAHPAHAGSAQAHAGSAHPAQAGSAPRAQASQDQADPVHPGESPPSGSGAVKQAVTDGDGRIAWGEVAEGRHTVTFATGPWFAADGRETFFPEVRLDVVLGPGHTHVALLLSPFAYTTYRGS